MLLKQSNSVTRDKSFCTEENLKIFLKNRNAFPLDDQQQLKYFIDNYSDCWRIWNKVRWDAAMNSEGVKELKEYLGDKFIPYYDSSWELAKEWTSRKRSTKADIENFYRNTKNYIYNSIIFYYSNDRIDLSSYWLDLKKAYNIRTVIDYGCGVGNDGLNMMDTGSKVIFADFDSPSFDFLKWRLKERNYISDLYQTIMVEELPRVKPRADMLWAVDVLEHMKDPFEIFNCIENVRMIVFFTDCDDKAGGRHPFHFKIDWKKLEGEFSRRNYKKIKHEKLDIWEKK